MSTAIYVDLAQPETRNQKPETREKWSNGQRRARNAYPTTGSGRLSNEQKARICMLAKRAYDREALTQHLALGTWHSEDWRRAQQLQVTGHASLTTCTQAHYLALVSHFAQLAGEDGVAYQAEIKDATAARRIALHKLQEECTARNLTLAWPSAICRSKFKLQLEDAQPRQLWQLVFHVRNSNHPPVAKVATKAAPKKAAPEVDEPF
jgi:hypothetical protein